MTLLVTALDAAQLGGPIQGDGGPPFCEDGDPIGVAPLSRQEKPVPEEWIDIPHSGCFFGQKGAL